MHDSAVIFSGTVLDVEHLRSNPNSALGITRITFRVRSAIRGVRPGQVLQIREWEGLWNAGERYHPGENTLLFLYPKSKLGLTSPVGGAVGRYSINQFGWIDIGGQHLIPKLNPPRRRMNEKDFAAAICRISR